MHREVQRYRHKCQYTLQCLIPCT